MCVCVRSCVCWKGWLELLWKDSLGESMRAWGILKALLKTLAYAVVVGRNTRGISFSLLLLREPHLHGFVPTCLLLPVPFPHKSILSPRKKAWRATQLDGPLYTLWWDL